MIDLWKSVAATSLARMYSLVVSMFLITIIARWLGPAGQGTAAAATTWATLFGTLGSLSLGQVAIHRATVRRDEQWLGESLGTLISFAVVITFGAWIVALTMYFATGGSAFKNVAPLPLAVALLLVPFVVWEFYGSSLLMASDKIADYNRAQLVGRSVAVVLMLACWLLRLGITAAISVSVISQAIVASLTLSRLWRLAETRIRATVAEAKLLLSGGLRLHLSAVSGYVFTSLGVLLVNHFRTAQETGWYQLSTALLNVMLVIPLAASQVIQGRVAKLGPDDAWQLQRRVMVALPLAMIGLGIIAAFAAPFAIPLVVGEKYQPAVPLFQLSLLGIVGGTFAAVMASQWISRGYFLLLSSLSIIVAAIHLGSSFILVPRYGMYGAVYANLITQMISIFGNGALAVRCEMQFRSRTQAFRHHDSSIAQPNPSRP